jgi:hypothetical protein
VEEGVARRVLVSSEERPESCRLVGRIPRWKGGAALRRRPLPCRAVLWYGADGAVRCGDGVLL